MNYFNKNNKKNGKYYNINDLTDLDKGKDAYNIIIIKLELYIFILNFLRRNLKFNFNNFFLI